MRNEPYAFIYGKDMTHGRLGSIGVFIICFVLFQSSVPCAQAGEKKIHVSEASIITIRAGSDKNYPPYEFLDEKGVLTGFNVELLKAVARVSNLDIRFVSGSWSAVRKALDTGELDMATGMFYSDDRARKLNFSLPHSMVYHSLFVIKGAAVETVEDTIGKSIVVIEDDIMHDYALSLGFKKDIVIVENNLRAVQLLSEGLHGAALLPKVQTLHILSETDISNVIPAGPLLLPQEYCFAVQKDLDHVLARLDQGLSILKASGEYQKLRTHWLGIMDGESYLVYLKAVAWGLFACVLMLAMTWVWNRTLTRRIKIHTRDLKTELAAHRRTLSDLEAKEEQLRGVLESSFDTILALDRNRRITRCNPAFERQFGYKMETVTGGSTLGIHIDEASYQKFQSMVYPEVECTGSWQGEWQYKTRDGRILDVETTVSIKRLADGSHDGYVAVMRDITKRKKTERERVRLATAIEQSADAVMITDVSGRLVFMNAAAERRSSGQRSQLLGTRLAFPQTGDDSGADFGNIVDRLTAGGVWHGKVLSEDGSGRQWEEEIAVSPVMDGAGEITNYIVVKRDITQVARLEQKLNHSRKMEAIGTLAGGIAHDFGNILASVIGYAEMALEDDLPAESPARHDVEQILPGCHRARELVERILPFSRRSKVPLKPLHLEPLIEEAVKFLRSALPESVTLECDFNCTDDLIFETPAKIYQLMVNLVTNASQAMAESGGKICISVSNPPCSQSGIPGWNRLVGKDMLYITVEDDGPGVAPEVVDKIFDPYFTTRDKSGGSGLGLSVVHGIVAGLSGTIDVVSRPGEGTCFKISLPLSRPERKAPDVHLQTLPGVTILLVDDEQDTVAVMRHSLIRLGYEVVAASNTESALGILGKDPAHFDLLIIDMALTDAPGIRFADSFARAAKGICPDLPVILCRGYNAQAEDTLPGGNRFDVILQRPFSGRQIAHAVFKAISIEKKRG